MIRKESNKPLAVISYDTQTYSLLCRFVAYESKNESVTRISPEDFLQSPSDQYQYINLVVKDFDLRKKISNQLDSGNLERWTFVSEDGKEVKHTLDKNEKITIGRGCFIYPAVWAYTGVIEDDVIIHSWVKLAENVKIGKGSFLSGDITIAGNCTIGQWCYIGNNVFFIDNICIANDVRLLPGTSLRKGIKEPGNYYNPYVYKIEKITL